MVAAVAGGLRRYMIEAGDDTDAGDVTAMVPVNLRPEHDTSLGNEFALVFLSLPVSMADAYDRLMMTKRHMDVLKNSPEPFLVYQILGVIGTLPGDVAKQATSWFAAKASAVLTNVPGPRQQIYFAGLPLKDMIFWVPQSGSIGLGISIFSYNGKVMLGLMVDEHLIREPQHIINGFEPELLDLERRLLPGPDAGANGIPGGTAMLSAGDPRRLKDESLICKRVAAYLIGLPLPEPAADRAAACLPWPRQRLLSATPTQTTADASLPGSQQPAPAGEQPGDRLFQSPLEPPVAGPATATATPTLLPTDDANRNGQPDSNGYP